MKFLVDIMSEEGLEHLTFRGHVESKEEETASNLPNELVEMGGCTGSGRDSEMINIAINYKGEEIVESHIRPCPRGTNHVEEL